MSIWPVSKRTGSARSRTLACVPVDGISSRSPLYISVIFRIPKETNQGKWKGNGKSEILYASDGKDALLASLILLQCGGSDQVQPVKSHKSGQRYSVGKISFLDLKSKGALRLSRLLSVLNGCEYPFFCSVETISPCAKLLLNLFSELLWFAIR